MKKVKDLRQHDFMMNSTAIDDKLNSFEFSSQCLSDLDGDEIFEDSVEVFENPVEKFMTPKPFKSIFAQHVEESLITPGTTDKKRTSSFAEFSPREETKRVKPIKSARTSSLPRPCKI